MPRVTSKGQVTIPKGIREELDIRPGDEITFEPSEEGYVLTKKINEDRFDRWKGVADTDKSAEEQMDELRGGSE